MKVYRLRNLVTGLYWKGYSLYGARWGPQGRQYKRLTDLKNSLSAHIPKHRINERGNRLFDPSECVLEEYHLQLVSEKPLTDTD